MKFKTSYSFFPLEKMIVGMIFFIFSTVSFGYVLPTYELSHNAKVKLKKETFSKGNILHNIHKSVSQQQLTITGTVTDEDGEPLPGVNVTVVGTSTGTSTDFDGNYELHAEEGQAIRFSIIGFDDQEITVDGEDEIDITMYTGQQSLGEVTIMVGYGHQRVSDNTSSISSVKSTDIVKTKGTSDLNKSIQGKVPGLQVLSTDRPGESPTLNIRGTGTVLSGRQPLYVVDGVFTEDISNLNSSDIESYDVLKDASALAIYGNRAANGAVIITTKEGTRDLKIEYSGTAGIKTPLKRQRMANSTEYANYMNTAFGETRFPLDQPYDTDWFKELTRTGSYNENNVSISGSSDAIKYYFSVNNYNEEGITRSTDHFNRTSLRANNEFKISKDIKLSNNFNATFIKESPMPIIGNTGGPYSSAFRLPSMVPVRYENGELGGPVYDDEGFASSGASHAFGPIDNPLSTVGDYHLKNKSLRLQEALNLNIDLSSLVSGLLFNSQFSLEYRDNKGYDFDTGNRVHGFEIVPSYENQLTDLRADRHTWTLTNYFNYTKDFNDHHLDFTVGTEYNFESGFHNKEITRINIQQNKSFWNLSGNNYGGNVTEYVSSNENPNKMLSYFGRLQYAFKDRYLITGTLRRDGTSKFSKGNKWGSFPSFGLGWRLTEEDFMANVNFLDELKFRGGWGRLGNQNIPLNLNSFTTASQYRYSFDGKSSFNGMTVDKFFDPTLSWEIVEEISFGLDFSVLDRRLEGTIDFYDKKTKDLILENKPISTSGFNAPNFINSGQISNRGVEIGLSWHDAIWNEELRYSINVNYSANKNSLDKITGENVNVITTNGRETQIKYFGTKAIGQPLGSFYLWKTEGYDDKGNFKYVDTNGNGKTGKDDADDKMFMGSYIPKQTLGISLGISYRNWDFSVDTYGQFGAKVYDGDLENTVNIENIPKSVANDFWTPDNPTAKNPSPQTGNKTESDYFLYSADFFRFNNIEIGYTFTDLTSFLSKFRIYFNANQPIIFQSYPGFSPTPNVDLNPYEFSGVERDAYPSISTYSLGLNISF